MPRRLLLLVLAAILAPASVHARVGDEPPASTQEEAKPAPEPEKKPDAFQYFFGRKEKKEEKKEPEASKPTEAPVIDSSENAPSVPPEAAPKTSAEPVAEPIPAAPKTPSQEVRPEATQASPETAKTEPKVDAFQYFFGRSAQPVFPAEKERKNEIIERKPLDAFDYFFGKNGKAGSAEEKPENPPPLL